MRRKPLGMLRLRSMLRKKLLRHHLCLLLLMVLSQHQLLMTLS